MSMRVVEWSDLPKEILAIICKSLDPRVDVPRFRGVCTSWRSSIPPNHALSRRLPLEWPHPDTAFRSSWGFVRDPIHLYESTLYLLKPLNPSLVSTSFGNKGWLIKVKDSSLGGLHLVDPLFYMEFSSQLKPTTLNMLNFRVVELDKTYRLEDYTRELWYTGPWPELNFVPGAFFDLFFTKVVMSPCSAFIDAFESSAFLMLEWGRLAFLGYGDKKWTPIDDRPFEHVDIIVYKSQFYVVDRYGKLSRIESSSLKLVELSPPFSRGAGNRKHLVESSGSLYVVDRLRIENMENYNGKYHGPPKTVDLKVYKLDEECGQWVLMKNLGDRAFFLGLDYSFSVSASELVGCKENCIYFRDVKEFGVFDLENCSIHDFGVSTNYSLPFCVTPTWFSIANP